MKGAHVGKLQSAVGQSNMGLYVEHAANDSQVEKARSECSRQSRSLYADFVMVQG